MSTLKTFPDIEALVGYIIRTANVTSLGTRVYSSIPKEPTYPLATYRRIGGVPAVRRYLDTATIQIDVWGTSKSTARTIAEAVRRAVMDAEGVDYTTGGGAPVNAYVHAVDDAMGLAWVPDQETGRDRYTFTLNVYAK